MYISTPVISRRRATHCKDSGGKMKEKQKHTITFNQIYRGIKIWDSIAVVLLFFTHAYSVSYTCAAVKPSLREEENEENLLEMRT